MKHDLGLHSATAALGAIAVALASPLAGQPVQPSNPEQPARQLSASEQQHLDAVRAYLESESNAIVAEQDRLQRKAQVLSDAQIRQQQAALNARIARYRASQQQAQSWLDSVTGRTPMAATVTAPTPAPAPSQPMQPAPSAAAMDGNNLTSFQTADGNFVMRAYREWVRLVPGSQRAPAVYSEASRNRDRIVIVTANELGFRSVIDLTQRQFRAASQATGMPITGLGSDVTGINLVRADYTGGSVYMRSRGKWIERSSQGKIVGRFQEIERTADSVTISDSSRGLFLVLRLSDRTINFGRNGSPDTQMLYPISGTSATYVEPQGTID